MLDGNSRGQWSNDRDSFGYETGATNTDFQGNLLTAQGQHVRSLEGQEFEKNGRQKTSPTRHK